MLGRRWQMVSVVVGRQRVRDFQQDLPRHCKHRRPSGPDSSNCRIVFNVTYRGDVFLPKKEKTSLWLFSRCPAGLPQGAWPTAQPLAASPGVPPQDATLQQEDQSSAQ
eukprot:3890744-Amphidinium_carterae.1